LADVSSHLRCLNDSFPSISALLLSLAIAAQRVLLSVEAWSLAKILPCLLSFPFFCIVFPLPKARGRATVFLLRIAGVIRPAFLQAPKGQPSVFVLRNAGCSRKNSMPFFLFADQSFDGFFFSLLPPPGRLSFLLAGQSRPNIKALCEDFFSISFFA